MLRRNKMRNEYCLILTTTDNHDIAEKIAKLLVENDLAKCTQIDQIKSYCKWEGKLLCDNEYRIMIKANDKKYAVIENEILKNHNYKLPQIVKLEIRDGLSAYLEWLN